MDLKRRIETAKSVSVGRQAPELVQKDSTGKPIALSSFRGKYVLVEFWASWCMPCRKENPELVKVFNKYQSQNFTILGISVDTGRKSWLRAVKQDQLPWVNTADLLGTDKNPAALAYDITAIPQNFLISPDGKIIARNLKGEQLEKTLMERLGSR